MSESATSYRPLGAEEFDRRMRSIQAVPAPAAHGEALAELARLVGEHDPFAGRDPFAADPFASDPFASMTPSRVSAAAPLPGPADLGEEPGAPENPAVVHAGVGHPDGWERVSPRFPAINPRDQRPIEPSPDVWARGAEAGASGEPSLTAERDPAVAAATSGNARRTVVVLAAVLALTGGGLAASFLAKPSGSNTASGAGGTPTILAATGPSKVKPATPATGEGAPSTPSTLLDKNNNDGTAAAKVVNTVEQPVDLNQAVKPSMAAEPAADAPASPFPEPRKVRTVVVRPDGSIIGEAPAGDSAADAPLPSTASQQASLAFDPKTALPIVNSAPAAAAADAPPPAPVDTPTKTTARATARAVAGTAQEGSAAAQARTPVATPKSRPKPVAVATATEADAPADAVATPSAATGNGKFAVQLGAAPSEAEGKQAASRLGAKFAGDLGGSRPGVMKAEAGGKTVYRIRVGNLSQEDAKSLCGKIKASGGGCFVARN